MKKFIILVSIRHEVIFKQAFSRWDTYNNDPDKDLKTPCKNIWERMYVWFDGKVNPCDADYKIICHMEMLKMKVLKIFGILKNSRS